MPPHPELPRGGRVQIELSDDEDDEMSTPPIYLDDDDDVVEVMREVTPKQQAPTPTSATIKLQSCKTLADEVIVAGVVVELDDEDFLRVHAILEDRLTGVITLEGNLIRRNSHVDDLLPKTRNEVCLCLRGRGGPDDPSFGDYLVTRAVADCKRIKTCFFTNESFPLFSDREHALDVYYTVDDFKARAQLVCRWKHVETLDTSRSKVTSMSLTRLREHECDVGKRCPDTVLLRNFLQTRAQEGAKAAAKARANLKRAQASTPSAESVKKRSLSDRVDVDLTGDDQEDEKSMILQSVTKRTRHMSIHKDDLTLAQRQSITSHFGKDKPGRSFALAIGLRAKPPRHSRKKTYTFGDICTGAGGAARGAQQADLKLNFLLDHWDVACTTLQLNFDTNILAQKISDFCEEEWYSWMTVDVLHISFPCQPHSAAHTRDGQDDAANIATAYCVEQLFARCKPRVVTFEQTSGIVTHNGGYHFRALVHQIIAQGYSVRTRICNLAEHANAHARKRLIIIAACPGELLPPFPDTTHGPGKLPYVTISNVLRNVDPDNTPDHMMYAGRKNEESYDPHVPLRAAITCGGGAGNLHPSGKRTFTLQELACLQGFPPHHQFFGLPTTIRKQIGNAVPAIFAKTLFQHIVKSLEESDRKLAAYQPPMIEIGDEDG